MEQASQLEFFRDLHCWLILNSNLQEAVKFINDTSFSVLTEFMIGISENESFYFYDVYNRCKYRDGILNITFAGAWDQTAGLNIYLSKNKIARRWNFHGMTLKMAGFVSI